MTNLTLTIDEVLLRRARIRALESGTSVNALVREFLARYAGVDAQRDAMQAFGENADQARAGSGPAGRTWTRDDLYQDA